MFALDWMVDMDGNTGPYLQYAHARLATAEQGHRRFGAPSHS